MIIKIQYQDFQSHYFPLSKSGSYSIDYIEMENRTVIFEVIN